MNDCWLTSAGEGVFLWACLDLDTNAQILRMDVV